MLLKLFNEFLLMEGIGYRRRNKVLCCIQKLGRIRKPLQDQRGMPLSEADSSSKNHTYSDGLYLYDQPRSRMEIGINRHACKREGQLTGKKATTGGPDGNFVRELNTNHGDIHIVLDKDGKVK